MILQDARIDVPYTVVSINLPEDSVRHLSNLGLKVGSRLELISKTKSSAIVMLKSSRLAFDDSILSKIDVSESQETVETLPLSELEVGKFAYIDNIFAVNEAKRRLMDMGLTRHTKIYLRKVAPLGDPIEISLRGYELTLRKSEAQMISVVKIDNQEEK
ncbi:ferrous iron transport protein A [Streptococcus mutans]|uniref:ferrous iron transport protein A n=1 Tax=Streptococcus mutans TaxID=1309 RepID=UPI000304A792|nr:ferrous iron transport protein A [Streptococcus mutans]MCB5035618.1 ferrous iron transport protein A [Streptococcus mutans]MDT9500867.1 ferrous iron transport protein A [Streptococcus mutans]NLQ46945.1 ferrous iron transport protein A [Streptococcus mutans]NLQ91079.1 ferrous iron transport protein A [Streptococcus mutans]PNM01330.1 ferrous iron transport protein A [Streptococcus mutans]